MAQFEEVIKLSVEGADKGTNSVKSLKQEIKQAQAEAIMAARSFGEFSPEATKAAQKVAQLKDEMGDFQQRVAALNPDKFQAIATVTQGIAGGVAAAQGAMALFGDTSEDTAKTLAKVQGAIAFSQGVQQILDLRNSLGAVAGMVKGGVINAFTALKGAIGATGIGLLVTGIGLLIANFGKVRDAVVNFAESIPGLTTVTNALGKAWDWLAEKAQMIGDAIGITNSQLDKQIEKLNASAAAAKNEADIIEAAGGNIGKAYNLRKKAYQDEIAALEKEKDKAKELADKRQEFNLFLARNQKRVNDERQKAQEDANNKALEQQKAHNQKMIEEERAQAERYKAIFDDLNNKKKAANAEANKIDEELFQTGLTAREKELRNLELWYEEKRKILTTGGEDETNLTNLYNQKIADLQSQWNAEDKAKQDEVNKQRITDKQATDKELAESEKAKNAAIKAAQDEAYQNTSSSLGAIAQLFGQATAAGKAFAIAQVAVDQAKALSSALVNANSPADPTNAVTGGLASFVKYTAIAANIFSGFARIKSILGASGSGNAGGAAGSMTSFGVSSGSLPSSDQTAGQLKGMGRVYVMEGDISRSQGNVARNRQVSVV